jgi:hypothetical protein
MVDVATTPHNDRIRFATWDLSEDREEILLTTDAARGLIQRLQRAVSAIEERK